ncbi:MAG: hypothetical protein GY865_06225 [candidate division Zixibacteria bacterium]|nr:hypothetical protein [candidate division Zixibacteria bacterium]
MNGPFDVVNRSAGASSKFEILVEEPFLSRPNGDWIVPGDGGDDDASEGDQMGGEESPAEVTSVCRTNFEEMPDRLSQTLPPVRLQRRKQRRNEIHCEWNTAAREQSKSTNECQKTSSYYIHFSIFSCHFFISNYSTFVWLMVEFARIHSIGAFY